MPGVLGTHDYDRCSAFPSPSPGRAQENSNPKFTVESEYKYESGLEVYGSTSAQPMVETVHPQSSSDMFSPGIEDAERVTSTPRIKRYCGLSRYPFFGLLAVVILIAALGLGLGLHFGLDKPKGGAQKGSGVVAIDSGENIPLITAYHQDRSGIIRQDIYRNGIWSMANDTVVTSDARDGSPLMALVYAMHGELTWRVLYVDKEDYLQEVINSNKSTGWTTGPLGSGRFKASNSSQVGLSACWNYEYYGRNNKGGGIRLYYGSAEGSVKELGWSYGSTAWDYLASFPSSNPDGGVECTVHGKSITNVWLLNSAGELEQRWYEFDTFYQTADHPAKIWVKGLTRSNILANSAITITAFSDFYGTSTYIHCQQPDGKVIQLLATGTAESSAWSVENGLYTVGPGIRGTKMGSVILNTQIGEGKEIHVFFQTTDHNLVDHVRTLDGITWSQQVLVQ